MIFGPILGHFFDPLDWVDLMADSIHMHIEMHVTGLTIDPVSNAPIVVLREKQGTRILPIWIGVIEASAIAFGLEKVKIARPMSHDLMHGMIDAMGGRVTQVLIADLKDTTFFARVFLSQGKTQMQIDARPSDAIALALRAKAPILCDEDVLKRAHVKQEEWEAHDAKARRQNTGTKGPTPIVAPEALDGLLEKLEPEAFGKYKM